MAAETLHGVFPILVTPFDEQGRIDEESLRRLVDYNVEAGVHGLGIALGSEIPKLSESERDHVIRTVVEHVRGRVPIVVNTSAPGSDLAVFYSQRAEELGAAAVMCTPPSDATENEIRLYFRAIADAVHVPIFIQDVPNAHVPAPLIDQIGRECERVRYAKVESQPPAERVREAVIQCGDRVTVFGGAGGIALLEELRYGSRGTMPFPATPEAFVRVWNLWQMHDHAAASRVFAQEIKPLIELAVSSLGAAIAVHKEFLRRRGILRTAHVRGPAEPLPEDTLRQIDELCTALGSASD